MMDDLFVLDIYTAEVFGVTIGSIAFAGAIGFLVQRFPDKADCAGKLILPFMFMLLLGFCSLQTAQLVRHIHSNDSKGNE